MASITLAQYAQLEKQPLKKGILWGIVQEGLVADILSWRSTGGRLAETGVRYDTLQEPDWIALDGSISSKAVDGKPLSYGVYQMAVHVDVPNALEDANADQLERTSVQQLNAIIKGAALKVNDQFINGDQASDMNGFEGINKLVGGMASAQSIGATEIDLTASYTDAIAESLFARIDQGYYACNGHKPTHVFCNSTLLLKMESVARQYKLKGNDFDWTAAPPDIGDVRVSLRTAATRPAFLYKGVPWYDLGVKTDQSTKVIGDTYTEGGSTAHGTRVFMIRQGENDVEGIQFSPLETKKIGGLEAKEVTRWRVLWTLGMAAWSPDCIVKLQGIRAV
jgi:hypothetical protein